MLKVLGEGDKFFILVFYKFVKKLKLIWEIINLDIYDVKSLYGVLFFFLCSENR